MELDPPPSTNEVTESGAAQTWLRSLWPCPRDLWLSYREVTVDGARARYLCSGSGPPLLLLASPLALARTYRRAIRTLCRSFTVVCVELPGSGGSERLREPWTTKRYAEWALELIRYLPLAAPVVVGHGASTAIAAELAALAPAEIGGLVIIDARGTSAQLGVRALPEVVWNGLRHRSTFAEHVKNACASSAPFSVRGLAVPTLRATLRAGDWKVVANDVGPLASTIRRFVAAIRHRPVFAT
jgi:pimeloyl-ACP methyl ester carboxylesterase